MSIELPLHSQEMFPNNHHSLNILQISRIPIFINTVVDEKHDPQKTSVTRFQSETTVGKLMTSSIYILLTVEYSIIFTGLNFYELGLHITRTI